MSEKTSSFRWRSVNQKRKNLNLGQVRKQLRPWINNNYSPTYKIANKSSIKLTPTSKEKSKIIAQFESFQTINNHLTSSHH